VTTQGRAANLRRLRGTRPLPPGVVDDPTPMRDEYVCPACHRDVRETRNGTLARHNVDEHGTMVASVWLRPGDRCPGSGLVVGFYEPKTKPTYGEPGWLDAHFGRPRSGSRPGNNVMTLRAELETGALCSNLIGYWPLAYGPPPEELLERR